MFNQLLNFHRRHDYMTNLAAKYGTYRLISPSRNEIYTTDPANGPYNYRILMDLLGDGIFTVDGVKWREQRKISSHEFSTRVLREFSHTIFRRNAAKLANIVARAANSKQIIDIQELFMKSTLDSTFKVAFGVELDSMTGTIDGDKWREQRKISSHEFSTKVLREFISTIFQKNAAKLANIVSGSANSKQIIDIQELFMKSTLDSIFKVAFGVELDSMTGTSESGTKFCRAFDDASALTAQRYVDFFWPIKKLLNVGSEAKLKKSVEVINYFVYKLIDSETHRKQSFQVKKDNILSRFLQLSNIDSTYLRDIILNFVIAGKDTTAGTLSWFIYMLCKHPEVQEKIAQEIENVTTVVKIADYAEFAASLTEGSLEKMHYLHASLTETLRLYPAVPVDPKLCFSDDTLPDGYSVNKGDFVAYQPYAMGRMKFLWGEDAEVFRPERWLNEDGIFQPESPFKLTAFQAGPRICLGKEFAYRQMKIFSVVLLAGFAFKLGNEEKPVNYRTMINLHMDGGLHVRAFYR
ncbi:hypothetical protein Nepgr_024346 [Nepenthes gracilis]|uniref:Cytochrome P450 n=1 Tax=Nepenthes gracilis TaxID=150966 RepID=A0AAD3T2M9_NEPGR|nr:hypothetical protein Nepgr_024346 [Nepenthes gracilis]